MSRRHVVIAALSWCLLIGCIFPEQHQVSPNDPVYLRSGASALRGARLDDVLVRSSTTVEDVPLTTQLVRGVAEKARQAVVSIYLETSSPHRVKLLPFGPGIRVKLRGMGLGSGFFIHPSGLILTNDHVVREADEIHVLTQTGADFDATVIARDPAYDLALVQVLARGREFPVLPVGDSDVVGVGDQVLAIGNPLGLGHTVTSGIISQTGRHLVGVDERVADPDARHVPYIQMDAPINPGSSGGPLITLTGAWIAVNTAAIPEAQNIGFAVPASYALEFLEDVLAGRGETEDG